MERIKFLSHTTRFGKEREFQDAIFAATGIRLRADFEGQPVDGHTEGDRCLRDGVCPRCRNQVKAGHTCYDIVLYGNTNVTDEQRRSIDQIVKKERSE